MFPPTRSRKRASTEIQLHRVADLLLELVVTGVACLRGPLSSVLSEDRAIMPIANATMGIIAGFLFMGNVLSLLTRVR